jgi:hypothetical protein
VGLNVAAGQPDDNGDVEEGEADEVVEEDIRRQQIHGLAAQGERK